VTINQRIRIVRESQPGNLSQTEFGAHIGVGQRAVSSMESDGYNITQRNIAAICREFHVREQWLRTGEGEMYEQDTPASSIDRILKESGATGLEAEVIKAYLELSPELRKAFIDHFRAYFARKKESAGAGPPGQPPDGEGATPHDS